MIKKILLKSISIKHAFFFALIVFILDQFSKYLIKSHIGPYDIIKITPFLNIVYVENIGSAFGMFKNLGNVFFIAVTSIAIVFISYLIIKDMDNRTGLSFILGGAAGNLMDRLLHGYVIDFLDVYIGKYHWPAFNIADAALTIGFILMIINLFFHKK